jgi:hypothetical protein
MVDDIYEHDHPQRGSSHMFHYSLIRYSHPSATTQHNTQHQQQVLTQATTLTTITQPPTTTTSSPTPSQEAKSLDEKGLTSKGLVSKKFCHCHSHWVVTRVSSMDVCVYEEKKEKRREVWESKARFVSGSWRSAEV